MNSQSGLLTLVQAQSSLGTTPVMFDEFSNGAPTNVSAATTTTTTVATTTTTTSSTTATTLSLSLVQGWNLLGNGSSGTIDVATAFGAASNVSTVWKWIANTTRWAFYAPSLVGQALSDYVASKGYDLLTTVNGGEGFWVNAAASFTTPLPSGTLIQSKSFMPTAGTHALPQGWSLIATGDSLTPSQFVIAIASTDQIAAAPPAPGGSPGCATNFL